MKAELLQSKDSVLCKYGSLVVDDPYAYNDGSNLYEFVGGNPVNLLDPLGLQAATTQPSDPPEAAQPPKLRKRHFRAMLSEKIVGVTTAPNNPKQATVVIRQSQWTIDDPGDGTPPTKEPTRDPHTGQPVTADTAFQIFIKEDNITDPAKWVREHVFPKFPFWHVTRDTLVSSLGPDRFYGDPPDAPEKQK